MDNYSIFQQLTQEEINDHSEDQVKIEEDNKDFGQNNNELIDNDKEFVVNDAELIEKDKEIVEENKEVGEENKEIKEENKDEYDYSDEIVIHEGSPESDYKPESSLINIDLKEENSAVKEPERPKDQLESNTTKELSPKEESKPCVDASPITDEFSIKHVEMAEVEDKMNLTIDEDECEIKEGTIIPNFSATDYINNRKQSTMTDGKPEDNSLVIPSISNITGYSDKDNLIDGSGVYELLNLQDKQNN
jgi:hypothetical protein